MRRGRAAAADRLQRLKALAGLARHMASAEPLAVAVLYHRIGPRAGDPTRELVPAVSTRTFARQLRVLRRLFRIVPAAELPEAAGARRRFGRIPLAVTFDDESPSHARWALPVLRAAGVRATFFVTGASLNGARATWWELLQAAVDAGLPVSDIAGDGDIHERAERLKHLPPSERDAAARALERLGATPGEVGMHEDDLRAVATEHDVGFHTLRHNFLPTLDDEALGRAMSDGRAGLERALGRPLELIAYPHGAGGRREAEAARRAGFRIGFTTEARGWRPGSDPLLAGRVELLDASPGSILPQLVDALRAGAARAVRLDPERERTELTSYLGGSYDQARLERYAEQLEDELRELGDETTLYRESEAYLYNLTAFAMTGTKLPYLEELARAVPPGSRVLDYGCGIGSDGLLLLEAGYQVAFADFNNPSVRYLRWRLERRGFDAPIYDLDREQPPDDFDLAYSFDVIEHVDDPHAFLDRLERHARHVLVNFLDPEPGETELHHELPVAALLRRSARRRLLRYRRFYGRSHLVLYRSEPVHGLSRARSLAALVRGRLIR